MGDAGSAGRSVGGEVREKILQISPAVDGGVSFQISYEQEGAANSLDSQEAVPLELVAQRGAFVVVREILQSSIPSLIGWDIMLDHAIHNSIETAQSKQIVSKSYKSTTYEVPF